LVRRRHVFYVSGYDPQGPEGYYRLFLHESKRSLKFWPIALQVGDCKIESDQVAYWDVESAGPNWKLSVRYEFLRLERFLRSNMAEPLRRQLIRAARWALDDLVTGTLWEIFRASWRFAIHLTYLQLMLVLWTTLAIAGALLAAMLATDLVGARTPIAVAIAFMVGVMVFALLHFLADRLRILQVANCWPYIREFARGQATGYDQPIEVFAARVVAAARANEADELVVIGHSSGGGIAAAVVARALELDPDLLRHRPRVVLLTLGSLLPAMTLHPAAARMRGAVRRLAIERALIWVDCQSHKDWLNFWRADPMELSGVEPGHRRCSLHIWQVRFCDMLSPVSIKRMQWKLLRIHYQFIMANEGRAPYDFFMLVCGPARVTDWASHGRDVLAAFSEQAGYDETWVIGVGRQEPVQGVSAFP
jgi:hypothetical protein